MSRHLQLLLCIAVPCVWCADTEIAGPTSGVVFDAPSRSLRRVVGVIGNAYVGSALAAELDWAQAGPQGRLALAVREGQMFAITGLLDGQQWVPVAAGVDARPLAWSVDGKQALLATSGAEALTLVGLENGAVTTQAIVIPGSGLVRGAVLLAGGRAIVTRQQGETGDVWLWNEGQLAAVPGLTRITGLTLAVDGTHAYGYDPLQSAVVRLRVNGGQIEVDRLRHLAGAGEVIHLGVQANGGAIYFLARSAEGEERWHIERREGEGDAPSAVELEVAPVGFSTGPSPRYRLIEYARKDGDPFFFLDLMDGSTLFVPAGGK